MTVIFYQAESNGEVVEVSLENDESFLNGLLRAGHEVPYGCREGVCHSCMMKVLEGSPPPQSQVGLTANEIEQGFFLSCCCTPADSIKACALNQSNQFVDAKVIEKSALNESIFRLRVENKIDYRPGQFLTLWNPKNIARSYSIASLPKTDDFIEFHIKRIVNGAFSDWAWQRLNVGDTLKLQGPLGLCYYGNIPLDRDLFLSGIGTGLSPLIGITRDALSQGHTGKITLLIGAKNATNFYLVDELTELARQHNNLSLYFIAQDTKGYPTPSQGTLFEGDIYQEAKQLLNNNTDCKIYLCGAPSFVKKMKTQCFLSGSPINDILSDPFIHFTP